MEHQTVDVGETFQSLLTGLYDETRQTQVRDMVYAIQPKTIEAVSYTHLYLAARNLKQKQFLIQLIENALDDTEAE